MSSSSSFEPALTAALSHALKHLSAENPDSVAATACLEELRRRLDVPLSSGPKDSGEVIEELLKGVEGGIHGSAGGRFFGWVIGGALPSALAADWLTSTWDQNSGLYAVAPASAVVEEVAGKWLKELMLLPPSASFAFVTGCQMAHFTCLAAARHGLLESRGWNVEEQGLFGAPRIRILTSTEKHSTLLRAARFLGIGEGQVVSLPADENGKLASSTLAGALAQSDDLTVVSLQAGDLNIGAFDDFSALIPLAKKHGAWVHIDGAFGLWVAASARYRHLLEGVEKADSWAVDGHKWLNVPYDCGYAFVANPLPHRASMSQKAFYLTHNEDARDQLDWTPEFSRRGRGFATYAAIRELGKSGVEDLIDRTCAHAQAILNGIGALQGAELLYPPIINQGLIRFKSPLAGATEADHDAFTDRIIRDILASGEAFFSGTNWRDMRAMRVSVVSWRTSEEDVDRVVRCVEMVLAAACQSFVRA